MFRLNTSHNQTIFHLSSVCVMLCYAVLCYVISILVCSAYCIISTLNYLHTYPLCVIYYLYTCPQCILSSHMFSMHTILSSHFFSAFPSQLSRMHCITILNVRVSCWIHLTTYAGCCFSHKSVSPIPLLRAVQPCSKYPNKQLFISRLFSSPWWRFYFVTNSLFWGFLSLAGRHGTVYVQHKQTVGNFVERNKLRSVTLVRSAPVGCHHVRSA